MHVSLTYECASWCSFAYSVLVLRIFSWFLLHVQAQSPEGLALKVLIAWELAACP